VDVLGKSALEKHVREESALEEDAKERTAEEDLKERNAEEEEKAENGKEEEQRELEKEKVVSGRKENSFDLNGILVSKIGKH